MTKEENGGNNNNKKDQRTRDVQECDKPLL